MKNTKISNSSVTFLKFPLIGKKYKYTFRVVFEWDGLSIKYYFVEADQLAERV